MDNKMTAEKAAGLLDWLYRAGYHAAKKGRDYDPRGHEAWQTCYDAIRQALSAPRVPTVPEGWKLAPVEPANEMLDAVCNAGVVLSYQEAWRVMMAFVPEHESMLAASPEPVALPNTERCPECGMLDGHAEGCPEYWIDMPANLRRQSNMEQHAQQLIADLRAEVEALRSRAPLPVTRYLVISEDEDVIEVDGCEILDAISMLTIAEEEEPHKAWSLVAAIDAARLREGGGE